MKRYASIVIVLGVILGGIALTRSNDVEYVAPEVVIEEKEVQVDALEKAIRDSQESKKAEIESTAQEAYDATYNQEMKKVELEVIKSFGEKLDARQIELEKETKTYWTRERIVTLIRETFPEDPERALAIAKCESGFNPNAKGPTQDSGIFQIHEPSHGVRMDKLGLDPFDVEDNVAYARNLYDEQGWKPWVCHTRGLAYNR